MLNKYLNYIQEGYLFSDKTISIDLDKFESGEINKLIIIGLSGAGKTTLGNHLSKQYKCQLLSTDVCMKKKMTEEDYRYFLMPKSTKDKNLWKKYYNLCFKPSLLSNEKLILDGPFYQPYHLCPETRTLINKYPVIILGKSALKAVWDRSFRILATNKRNNKEKTLFGKIDMIRRGIILNFKQLEPQINFFRKERIKISNDIKEFKVSKIKGIIK